MTMFRTTFLIVMCAFTVASPLVLRRFDPTDVHKFKLLNGAAPIDPAVPNSGKCVDVEGANFKNGTPIDLYDCNGTPAQQFTITAEDRFQIKSASHPSFCVDAGTNPKNGSKVHLWTCHSEDTFQQTWTYTTMTSILRIADSDLCLDLTDGKVSNGNQLQVYQCSGGYSQDGLPEGNENQRWGF
ncbi:19 kDa protein having G-X-X-X-Q-X-W motif-containing protein [Flagelloscypha sp. PMI_526]|nr:19 kDa protein having G-X-X-X-Q-X-W motif-containing protein [Flagelloscypha sp. PMI_526]